MRFQLSLFATAVGVDTAENGPPKFGVRFPTCPSLPIIAIVETALDLGLEDSLDLQDGGVDARQVAMAVPYLCHEEA